MKMKHVNYRQRESTRKNQKIKWKQQESQKETKIRDDKMNIKKSGKQNG